MIRAFAGGVGTFGFARFVWSPPIKCLLSLSAARSSPRTSSYGRRQPLQ
jgi:hypothetical protein